MIDFNAEVLAVNFDVFAIPVTFISPAGVETAGRGILSRKPLLTEMDEDAAAVMVTTLGVRVSELAALPGEGWNVRMADGTLYRVPQAANADGQGKADLILTR